MSSAPTPTCAQRFFDIAEALCRAVGNAIRPGFIPLALALLVTQRIHRVRLALLALETRFLAGTLRRITRKPRPAEASEAVVDMPPHKTAVQTPRLHGRLAWLCPLVPSYAAGYANHMRMVLAEPEMQALLAACPQAVRVLGPLCRMLGIARAEFVPPGMDVKRVRPRRARRAGADLSPVQEIEPRPLSKAARLAAFDWEREDAHYAFTGVPRRFRMRVI